MSSSDSRALKKRVAHMLSVMFRKRPSDRSDLLRSLDTTVCVTLEFGVPPLQFKSSIEVLGPGCNPVW